MDHNLQRSGSLSQLLLLRAFGSTVGGMLEQSTVETCHE